MPTKPLSAFLLTCERFLQEKDGVFSAIRIVDLFSFDKAGEVLAEQKTILVHVLGAIRVPPEDKSEHAVQINLVRPDGEVTSVSESKTFVLSGKFEGAPGGLNINAQIGVIPKQLGTHHISLLFDGDEVANAYFTLIEHKQAEKSPE